MADGFTLEIDADMAERIARKAEKSGMTREEAARFLLEQQLFDYDDYTWLNGDPRDPPEPVDPNEPTIPWEELKADLIARHPKLFDAEP